MLNIIGAGYAYPSTVIDNQFLSELGLSASAESILRQTGIEQRYSSLPLKYLRETRNLDLTVAKQKVLENSTDLGLRACKMALHRANIAPEEVGLIIGDGVTPTGLVPAESQRVAGVLGLKVQAYDVITAGAAFPFFADMLTRWRSDSVPPYVLCFSTGTATQLINYRDGCEGLYFGDGAGALVFSCEHAGRLRVKAAVVGAACLEDDLLVSPVNEHWSLNCDALTAAAPRRAAESLQRLKDAGCALSACTAVIQSEIEESAMERLLQPYGVKPLRHWGNLRKSGHMPGSGALSALGEKWDEIEAHDEILISTAGLGPNYGAVVLEAC